MLLFNDNYFYEFYESVYWKTFMPVQYLKKEKAIYRRKKLSILNRIEIVGRVYGLSLMLVGRMFNTDY